MNAPQARSTPTASVTVPTQSPRVHARLNAVMRAPRHTSANPAAAKMGKSTAS